VLADVWDSLAAAAAVESAARLGVLARLDIGAVDAATLTRECGLSERGAQMLLAALAGIGLVEATDNGAYAPIVPNLAQVLAWGELWNGLDIAVRLDRPVVLVDSPTGAQEFYPQAVSALAALLAPAAERAADHLAGPGLHVLDVGAGAAPWSLAVAARDPGCRVTAVDLPAVLSVTRQAVQSAGWTSQFTFQPGDIFALEMAEGAFDLAIAGNLCHLFDPEVNRRLLARLFVALRPGGRIAILDALPNERLDGPRPVVLYALSLLLRTHGGRAYPFSTYVGWLRDAGYEEVEREVLSSIPPISLVTARRPA
jgi:SAM-dependent methyltransferase